ncbi:hypothetical protein EON82_15010 [bacterium]|nr:MAG: hypothetical protein EON82_15010 [bacterium]
MTPQPPKSNGSRTILIVLGVVFVSILLCCGGCGIIGLFGYQKGKAADAEAKAFAQSALPAGKTISRASLEPFLASTWSNNVPKDGEAKVFTNIAKKLGPLKSIGEFTTSRFYFGSQNGQPAGTRLTLSAPVEFAKADGTITLKVAKIDEKWGIESLHVDSDAFTK